MPDGAVLTGPGITDNRDGTFSVDPAHVGSLAIMPPANAHGDYSVTVTVRATEGSNGDSRETVRSVPFSVAAVADAPILSAAAPGGAEDTAIPLTISAALTDTDGSETLGPLLVSGVPDGFSLSAGTGLGGGSWSVPVAAIGGLALIAPAGWTGDVVLGLSIISTEAAGPSATTTAQLTVTVENLRNPPVIDLVIATPVAARATWADLIGTVTVTEPDGDAIVSATVTLGAGRDASDRIVVTGHALTADGDDLLVGDTGIRVVGGGLDPGTGVLTLSGAASASTYAAVLDGLTLVNVGGGRLAIGTRSVTVTLTDATGEAASDATLLIVASSVISGDGTDQTLQGSNGADVIVGSSGNETLRGLAGNDLFLIETGGGADIVQGGGGFDTLMLKGVTGGPVAYRVVAGDWTLVLDSEDPGLVQGDASLVFSEAASGRIVFGDGSQVEFSQLERITW